MSTTNQTYFITAIDTDAGKTIVTGLMAKYLLSKGKKVITQKLAQTGCKGQSDDIIEHRRIMNIKPLPEDKNHLTCPYIFEFPASPHLSAALEKRQIMLSQLKATSDILAKRYDILLIEGVGGLMVPLNKEALLIDHVQNCDYTVILVTNGKLGSINHTLLSLEICKNRGIRVIGLIFNHFLDSNETITYDTLSVFRTQLNKYYPEACLIEVPKMSDQVDNLKFEKLFK